MTRARAWVTLSTLAAAVGSLTVSCGSDEVTGGGGKMGGLLGGSAGTASGGRTGTGGSGGSATGGSTAKTTNLGRACATNATCGTASGLTCVTGSVPQGVCSAVCDTDADCQAIATGALCSEGLCIEGCAIGPEALNKCHSRTDFSCQLFDAVMTSTLCVDDEDCPNSSVCNAGSCLEIITACKPTCGSDDDCAGDFCNIGTGLCQATKPAGKGVGAACDANADPPTTECAGICIGDSADTFSLCSGQCTFGVLGGCGWNGTGPADAGCLFVPRFVQNPGEGDVGYCGQLCDCNADCLNPTARCLSFVAIDFQNLSTLYQRQGYCGTPNFTKPLPDVVLSACGAGGDGAGGASAGAPGGGAGGTSGGAAGDGGAGG